MRDSALKPQMPRYGALVSVVVGEELMRDSALKHERCDVDKSSVFTSEKSSCATAL